MATALLAIGTAMSVGGTIMQGRMAENAAKLEQWQYNENAKRTRVASQQVADQYISQADLLQSRAKAVAAASGAGGVQVDNIISDIGAEGEYRALMALYNGETTARTQEFAGEAAMYEGTSAKRASYLKAGGTVLSLAGSQWDRY